MKPHAKRRIALKRVYHDLLNTVCQLECELDLREQELIALRRTKANLVRWAKRYRKAVLANTQRKLRAGKVNDPIETVLHN